MSVPLYNHDFWGGWNPLSHLRFPCHQLLQLCRYFQKITLLHWYWNIHISNDDIINQFNELYLTFQFILKLSNKLALSNCQQFVFNSYCLLRNITNYQCRHHSKSFSSVWHKPLYLCHLCLILVNLLKLVSTTTKCNH